MTYVQNLKIQLHDRDLAPEPKSLIFNKEVNKEINGFWPTSKTWKFSSGTGISPQSPNLEFLVRKLIRKSIDFDLRPKPENSAPGPGSRPRAESLFFNKEVNKEIMGFWPTSKT